MAVTVELNSNSHGLAVLFRLSRNTSMNIRLHRPRPVVPIFLFRMIPFNPMTVFAFVVNIPKFFNEFSNFERMTTATRIFLADPIGGTLYSHFLYLEQNIIIFISEHPLKNPTIHYFFRHIQCRKSMPIKNGSFPQTKRAAAKVAALSYTSSCPSKKRHSRKSAMKQDACQRRIKKF